MFVNSDGGLVGFVRCLDAEKSGGGAAMNLWNMFGEKMPGYSEMLVVIRYGVLRMEQ